MYTHRMDKALKQLDQGVSVNVADSLGDYIYIYRERERER